MNPEKVHEVCPQFGEKCESCRRYWARRRADGPTRRVVRWGVYYWQRVIGERSRLTYVDTLMFRTDAERLAKEAFGQEWRYEVIKEGCKPCRPIKRGPGYEYHEPARRDVLEAWAKVRAA